MKLIGAASTVFTLVLAFVISGSGQATNAQQRASRPESQGDRQQHEDGERTHRDGQAIFRFDTFGDEQLWTGVLRMHEPLATVDPATALAVGLKVDVEALPPAIRRRASRRTGRPDRPRGDHGIAAARCGRRRQGQGERERPADQRRRDLRAVPLDRRQLPCPWYRQAVGWLGESRSECRCDRRLVAGAAGCAQGRVPHVGSRQVRSQTPCVRRHEPHSAEQSIAADCHPFDLRTEGRRLRNVHG